MALVAEEAKLKQYQIQLDALNGEAKQVVNGIARENFSGIRERFEELMIKADVGIIDIAWMRKEEHKKRAVQLSRNRTNEIQWLDDEFEEADGFGNRMSEEVKILIVDDDANTRTTLSDLLAESGYEIITAADGKEAIERVKEEKPYVVLMDIRLPGIDGYKACLEIKKMKEVTAKIVLYTAYVDAVNVAKAREAGADDFLAKTSDFSDMLGAVEKLL